MGNACSQCSGAGALSAIVGKPTAAVVPVGQCQLSNEPVMCYMESKTPITHDTMVATFRLPDATKPLNLPTCACILACWSRGLAAGEPIRRPYTPISTNELVGKFRLLIKRYPDGLMSNHLWNLPVGQPMMFLHMDHNVKLQYPFRSQHITMLVGGTGITPMIQALHAILGSPGDNTKVSLIFGNKTQDDILGKELLDSWARNSGGRLTVTHVLSDANEDRSWTGFKGYISKGLISANTPSYTESPLIMVCGPPLMYESLCGKREEKDVTGILGELGYKPDQVYKF